MVVKFSLLKRLGVYLTRPTPSRQEEVDVTSKIASTARTAARTPTTPTARTRTSPARTTAAVTPRAITSGAEAAVREKEEEKNDHYDYQDPDPKRPAFVLHTIRPEILDFRQKVIDDGSHTSIKLPEVI